MPKGMQGILSLSIKDAESLFRTYMPFISNGGLFIPTQKKYKLGEDVFIRLSVMNEGEKIPVTGKVIWVTPVGAHSSTKAGIGVQFNDPTDQVRTKIEAYIAGSLNSDKPTHTM